LSRFVSTKRWSRAAWTVIVCETAILRCLADPNRAFDWGHDPEPTRS
jgi:hypothetical protein